MASTERHEREMQTKANRALKQGTALVMKRLSIVQIVHDGVHRPFVVLLVKITSNFKTVKEVSTSTVNCKLSIVCTVHDVGCVYPITKPTTKVLQVSKTQ